MKLDGLVEVLDKVGSDSFMERHAEVTLGDVGGIEEKGACS